MKPFLLLIAVILSVISCLNYQKVKNVILLTDSNFEEVLQEIPNIVVLFFTPWCGVCKKFAHEYSKAASLLEKENITFGQIDSSLNKNITKRYEIHKYPTLKLFSKGEIIDYKGEISEKDVIKFLRKHSGPLLRILFSIEQIEDFKNDNPVVMIYFGNTTENFKLIEEIAQEYKYYSFGHCSNVEIYPHFNLTDETHFVMFKQFDEMRHDYNGTMTKDSLIEFISYYIFPKSAYFNQYSAQVIFGNKKPGLFLYRTKHYDKREFYEDMITEIGDKLNRELQVIVTGLSEDYESRLAFLFGITAEDLPAIYIHDTRKRTKTYKMKGEINEENILAFVEQWKRDELVPIWKSEEVPKEQGIVYQIVGKTYETDVLKSKKDVLILFFSPYEEKIREFWNAYKEIAIQNKDNDKLLISFVYSTHNDIESVELNTIPSLFLWQVNNKELLLYEEELNKRSVELFLKKNSIYPFEIEEENKEDNKPSEENKSNENKETKGFYETKQSLNNSLREDL